MMSETLSNPSHDSHDILIIGSGAGGGPLALTLSQAGFSVLVLEKGPRMPREAYAHDEIEVLVEDIFRPNLEDEPHLEIRRGWPGPRRSHLGWIATCVGGGTVHMGGFLYRYHPDDFRMRSRFGDHGELADWPYEYAELEPYYTRAEWEVGISGQAGSDPFEGPRSKPYPMPPLDAHPAAEALEDACAHHGLHAFPTPRSVTSRPYQGRPACSYCQVCAGFGCPTGSRGSTQEALLPRAEATGLCEVRAEVMVREITVATDGRATGCVYLDAEGHEHRVRAKVVCVCCSAVESARLLLMSRSQRFPDGLANGNGLVGRHLQFHSTSAGQGRFEVGQQAGLQLLEPAPFLGRSVSDFYFLPPGVGTLGKGGILRFDIPPRAPLSHALDTALGSGKPIWGDALKKRLHDSLYTERVFDFEVFHDYFPNAGTFMELDTEVLDKWGLPVARLHVDPDPHHETAGRWLVDRGLEIFETMGASSVETTALANVTSFLVHGTCRAGSNPKTSVLDPYCRAHEVPNLFVVDGSFMPTSGGAPPTLTILANSFRVGDHIVERARRGELG